MMKYKTDLLGLTHQMNCLRIPLGLLHLDRDLGLVLKICFYVRNIGMDKKISQKKLIGIQCK